MVWWPWQKLGYVVVEMWKSVTVKWMKREKKNLMISSCFLTFKSMELLCVCICMYIVWLMFRLISHRWWKWMEYRTGSFYFSTHWIKWNSNACRIGFISSAHTHTHNVILKVVTTWNILLLPSSFITLSVFHIFFYKIHPINLEAICISTFI